ncbi:MAG: aminotransferase class IV [Devosia sp.]
MSEPDFSKGAAWIRGEIVPISKASIGVNDWGLTHSDITYDVVPCWDGAFFRLPDYLDRFFASMAAARMSVPQDRAAVRDILHAMVARTGLTFAYVAMVVSRGVPMIPGTRDPRHCANHFYAWCVPYIHIVPEAEVTKGVKMWVSETVERIPDESVDQTVKNYHWGDFTRGLFEGYDHGANTTCLLDRDGNVTEGPGFNVFAVMGNTVVTPSRHCLKGMTRRTVLELADEAGYVTEERDMPVSEFLEADEVFITSSGGGVIPIVNVKGRIFGNGVPGPVTMALREAYVQRRMAPQYRDAIHYG